VGTGTGILIPLIQQYAPGTVYACDLSERMLEKLNENHSEIKTIASDVRDVTLPDGSVDVVFINACYANIADKPGTFRNLARMMTPGGRVVISHPLGKQFVAHLKKTAPYPLDDFPGESEAKQLLSPFGFDIQSLLDEPELFILVAIQLKGGPRVYR
jgi:ubiquinone/menaquinone biosynthesis C-methylase UbiE